MVKNKNLTKLQCLVVVFLLSVPLSLCSQTLDDAFDITTSGIIAERFRMTIIAENLANNMNGYYKDRACEIDFLYLFDCVTSTKVGR